MTKEQCDRLIAIVEGAADKIKALSNELESAEEARVVSLYAGDFANRAAFLASTLAVVGIINEMEKQQ